MRERGAQHDTAMAHCGACPCTQARLTGMPTDGGDAAVQAAAAALQARGVSHVLVKLGKHGSLMVPPAPAAPLRQPALRADKVRSHVLRMRRRMPLTTSRHCSLRRWLTPRARATASLPPLAWR